MQGGQNASLDADDNWQASTLGFGIPQLNGGGSGDYTLNFGHIKISWNEEQNIQGGNNTNRGGGGWASNKIKRHGGKTPTVYDWNGTAWVSA